MASPTAHAAVEVSIAHAARRVETSDARSVAMTPCAHHLDARSHVRPSAAGVDVDG
jgi:hypothetical protein